MKILVIALIGLMAWQSPEIRSTTADLLESAAESVRPESDRSILRSFNRTARKNGWGVLAR